MANTLIPVIGPVIKILSSTDATTLAASVATQVNTLNQQLVYTPGGTGTGTGTSTSGTVQTGTIVIDPVVVAINTQGAITYVCSVRWMASVVPS